MTEPQLINDIKKAQHYLSAKDFNQALSLSQKILTIDSNSFDGWLIQTIANQSLGNLSQALTSVNNVIIINQQFAMAYVIKCQILKANNNFTEALQTCRVALDKFPENQQLWLECSKLLYIEGNKEQADEAFKQHLIHSAHSTNLQQALKAFFDNDLPNSEKQVRQHLKQQPSDPSAIRLLGEIALTLGVYEDAQRLFEKALTLAPNYHLARLNYAHCLNKRERGNLALQQINQLEVKQPNHPPVQIVKAAILVKLGQYQAAIELYQQLLAKQVNQAQLWASLGHTYKTTGQTEQAVDAYLKAIHYKPLYGDAYWSLANLKTYEFTAVQIDSMLSAYQQLKSAGDENLAQICFALGKAYEAQQAIDHSFQFYKLGNDIKKTIDPYSRQEIEQLISRNKLFFKDKQPAPFKQDKQTVTPIFIVGLPRSGSTLLEQILSSHSAIDGTKELPDIMAIARQLGNRKKKQDKDLYPHSIAELTALQRQQLGENYINSSAHLRSDAPYFIDKMPNNYLHIGLIKSILPQAKIIDARRLPVATGFSCFKQLFATGQNFSNDISDITHYYQQYTDVMSFWQTIYSEDIHTVHYEQVIENIETQVKRLLAFIGLPFEQNCLTFYDNKRAVATASAEQVRQPINNKGLTAWQPYVEYLQPLVELSATEVNTVEKN